MFQKYIILDCVGAIFKNHFCVAAVTLYVGICAVLRMVFYAIPPPPIEVNFCIQLDMKR